jgi:negative regulator of replication initiation
MNATAFRHLLNSDTYFKKAEAVHKFQQRLDESIERDMKELEQLDADDEDDILDESQSEIVARVLISMIRAKLYAKETTRLNALSLNELEAFNAAKGKQHSNN